MINASTVKLTIGFNDAELSSEEREEQAQWLLNEMRQMDEIESVEHVLDLNPPPGNKSIGGFLVGLLTTEVSHENFKKLMGFLGDRLSGKPIELEVEANGKKLRVVASNPEELEAAIEAAKEFVAIGSF
jgi:hypothetical protein